jgi:hypothetical protein
MASQKNPCGDAGEVPDRVPPHLKKAMNDLLHHESTILNHLNANPDAAAKFLSDPAAVLAQLKIPMDPTLAATLKNFAPKQNPLAQRTFCLPNGTQVTPNIKISFVAHTKSTTTTASEATK